MLHEGRYASVRELAKGERVERTYVADLLRLTLLAPEIVEAILDGRQSYDVTLAGVMGVFPVDWAKQKWLVISG